MKMADDPPYLTVGTEVSAKYKGAFCEAKIRKVVRIVKCKVTFKAGNGSALLTDDQIKGTLRIGATVEAKHPDKNQFLEANINKIQDCSQYTVVFDDGDITTLRRSALCLKSGRHFNESETLDQLPLTHPEHFSNPVVGGRRGVRRRVADKDESSDEEDDDPPAKTKDGKKKVEKELDMGKVVCVESTDKKKSKETWFPALVVSPSAQETAKIRIKDEYLVRSFRDGRYYTVPKKEITEFTKDSMSKYESNSNVLRSAVEKALSFQEKNELPPHWDREVLFGNARQSESGEDQQSESETSEDDRRNEEKDRFIAQLYKFMDDRGTPMNKVPQVFQKDLDLHKLFKTVKAKAGYNKVTSQGQWKSITIKLGYGNMPSTSTINLVKQAYKKYLFNFEEFYRKLGNTWETRATSSSSKPRNSRSIFRERITPSSSRESTRDSKKGGDDDDSSTASSSKRGDRETKDKILSAAKDKDKDAKEEEKDKRSASSPEAESPTPGDTGSETSEVKQKETVEEPRKSSRGRQPKKDRDAVEEAASPSSSSTTSASSRKKRQTKPSSASRERDRDSSVASSTKDDGPPTPSSSAAASAKKGPVTGRGKYKRQGTKGTDSDEKEKEPKEEVKVEDTIEVPTPKKTPEVRLGDKLQVYYPKSEGKTYEAKVIDINEKNESFLVHYTGWNNRYDEWIDHARVSVNITLRMEQSGEVDGKAAAGAAVSSKEPPKGPGAKQRKGRNSSSATSNTSASSTTTTTTTTPSTTRSSANKANVAAAAVMPPTTPTTGSKRRRSTSSEIVQMPPALKRRRTRQKSGPDSQAPGGPPVSESEPETSDSDGKSIKSEKVVLAEAQERQESKKTAGKDNSIAANDTKPSSGRRTAEDKETKSVIVEAGKAEKKQPEVIDLEDEVSSSSVTSTKSKDAGKSSTVAEDSKESTSSSGSSGAVLDINQIRLELKGIDMVKPSPGAGQQPSPTAASVSSPTPPTLSAAVGSSPPPPEPTKVDIYEFQEDGSDDTAPPPITPSAPKLKMFSPAARSTNVTAEKEKDSPTVSANSAEAVAKLQLSQEQEKTPVPLVAIEKLNTSSKIVDKSAVSAESQSEAPNVKVVAVASVSSSAPITIKEVTKGTSAAKEVIVTKPSVISTTASVITATPITPVATTPSPTPVVSVTLQSTPPLPVLTSPAPPPVVISTPSTAPSLVAVTAATTLTPVIISTTSKTGPKVGPPPKTSPLPSTPIAARISLTSTPQPPPPVLMTSSLRTPSPAVAASAPTLVSVPSVVTLTPVIPSSVGISGSSTQSTMVSSSSSPVTSPPPPVLLQQQPVRPLLCTPPGVRPPVITISSPVPTPASTLEKQVLPTQIVAASVGSGTIKAIIPTPSFVTKKPDFPHLAQPTHTIEVTSAQSIPTISIITAPTSLKPQGESSSDTITQQGPQIQPAQISTVPQPVKVAATIPPPPPIVIKQVIPATTSGPSVVKPMFGPGPVGITPAPIDTPKQKKKKAKSLGSSTTPVKTLAPLPTSGAPPPPPVIVSMSSSTSTVTSTGNVTPTPGRKTPVKKRIPPPMDSPGKPIKSVGIPGLPSKPGKMNSEAMNAAIASVGAATPPTIAVPTTVITSTSAIFQTHPGPGGGVIFSTTTAAGTPPPPPVNIAKTNMPVPIKSTPESIAASIAAVASMGGSKAPPPISSKSSMPTKRFMKDSSMDKFGMNKDKVFPGSSGPPPLSTPQGPPPPIVIGKANLDSQHSVSQQQTPHQPPPPPITIQAKFQPTHSITGHGIPSGPAVTFVKATPSGGPGGPQGGIHHHVMEPHNPHQIHPQPNLHKNPVIFLPGSPVVIKPPYQHHAHATISPIIVSKPLQIDGTQISVSSSQPSSQQTSVLVTSAPSMMKSTMLPITVTPSNVQVTTVPVSMTPLTPSSVGVPSMLSTSSHHHQQQHHPSAVELKQVTTADLPPSITVTKATTVMKSISPDIVAVSSYNSSVRNTSFTPVKPEERSNSKEPEIVVKPAPASAQIVFHTAAETKKVEIVKQQHPPIQTAQHHHAPPPPPPPVTITPSGPKTEVREPEENSLLCEEIIPGSPTTGEDAEDKLDDEEKEVGVKKKGKQEDMPKSSKQMPMSIMEPAHVSTPPPPVLPPAMVSGHQLGSGGKPVIVLGPKYVEDALDDVGFVLEERRSKFGDDDDDDNKMMEDRSVDSPMGPPSEGREADLPFRDSFSDGGDHSPPSSPSTTSTISTDNSSRRHHTSRLSPTPEGGSSKSKDSDDDEDIDSDVGSKSTHLDDADSKHGSTRGSTRIRNQTSRLGRSPSPPPSKRRRMMNRRNKSPEEARYTPRTIRTSSGRKVTPVGRHGESLSEREEKVKQPPPPPPVNLGKPPKTGRYNFIPNLNGVQDPEQKIAMISQAINDLKDQYQKTKNEAASFDRRVKRWKRRVREKERLARQEATRAAS